MGYRIRPYDTCGAGWRRNAKRSDIFNQYVADGDNRQHLRYRIWRSAGARFCWFVSGRDPGAYLAGRWGLADTSDHRRSAVANWDDTNGAAISESFRLTALLL